MDDGICAALNSPVFDAEDRSKNERVARVGEQLLLDFPKDLYIPPDALAVMLEAFEGPLDLLLYLIRKQDLDILNIPIAEVTRQYLHYIETMQDLKLELAAEYLAMAAWLAEIKSRMMLPRPPKTDEDEVDPRIELVRRLQDYEQLRAASQRMDSLPRIERDFMTALAALLDLDVSIEPPRVSMDDLLAALRSALQRAAMVEHHHIQREAVSLRERMAFIVQRAAQGAITLYAVLRPEEGRRGVVLSFLAVLELLKAGTIDVEYEIEGLLLIAGADTP